MPLRTDRQTLERAARAVVLVSLALLAWQMAWPARESEVARATSADLHGALRNWTVSPPAEIRLELSQVPSAEERDWLAALRRAGSAVQWSGDLKTTALEVATTTEPHPWYVLRAVIGGDATLSDQAREIARLPGDGPSAALRTSALSGVVKLSTNSATASATVGAAVTPRRVLVVGAADWESKFTAAALEESGWEVDLRVLAAPGVVVGVPPATLDTSRYSAAVVLNLPATEWVPTLTRFVGSGGGLVVAGEAVSSRSLSALLPARAGNALPRVDTTLVHRSTLDGTALVPAARAVLLETRGELPLLVAARSGSGRVIASGYRDTWRWRMQGSESSPADHRDWWSSLVGAVAFAPAGPATRAPESAPLAGWIAAMGPGAPDSASRIAAGTVPWTALLFAIFTAALLFEVFSRRQRGLA